jgi:hypothetical protein
MKRYALHSCELLIEALNHARPKRYSLSREEPLTYLQMRDFPRKGYIGVDNMYANILQSSYKSMFIKSMFIVRDTSDDGWLTPL